ncbi:putative zinc- or iron-chelating protein [Acidovorax sp. 107]|uniref:YkgJ family cysteine cluster protein n=1 Tax=Acidovorax sp. 107 TaxID=2135638 RepID=UPI000D36CE70|nr:YkgJ family cysteine cluster protein [Acidovorax sp. 107]PUA97292.1 putative zinc- or iron-chelating protein [Acidovorax sp. 107]
MTSPPSPALTEAEQAAFLQSIARVRSAAGRALRAAQTNATQGAAADGTDAITADEATTEATAQAAVDFIAQLHQGLDAVAEQARATGPQLACQAGCAHCCYLRVEATEPEVLHIAQYLRSLPDADQAATTRRLQQHGAAASAANPAQPGPPAGPTRQPCSFLIDDRCAIYTVRPAACRKAHSLSATHCAEQSPTIPQNLRLLVDAEALMAGTALAYRDQPLPARAHELNAAVLAALDGAVATQPSALLRWYRGDDGALAMRSTPP